MGPRGWRRGRGARRDRRRRVRVRGRRQRDVAERVPGRGRQLARPRRVRARKAAEGAVAGGVPRRGWTRRRRRSTTPPAISTTSVPRDDLADQHERLVDQLGQLAADIQGTADQARVPGFEDILPGSQGLNFESWDEINAILAELRRQGIEVEPLARQTHDRLTERSRGDVLPQVMRRISPIVLVACALAGVWGLTGAFAGGSSHVPTPDFPDRRQQGHLPARVRRPQGPEAKRVLRPRAPRRRREVGRPGERAPADRPEGSHGRRVPREQLPRPHARGRQDLGAPARRDARDHVPIRAEVERSRLLRRIRHGHGHASRNPAHSRAAQGDPELPAAAHSVSPVHVLPRLWSCIHARLSQPALERGHRLQVARRALHSGLRPGRVPRLLDLAQRRRRHRTARRTPIPIRARSARATRSRAPAGTGSSGNASSPRPSPTKRDLRRLCRGVAGAQRAGCIGGASLLLARGGDPVYHARTCGRLSGNDALNCLRGVNVPALAGNRYEQIRLLRTCTGQPQSTRNGCYAWFGRTLNVVTNGRFERSGLPTAEHLRGTRRVCRGCTQARRAARHVLLSSDSPKRARFGSMPAGDFTPRTSESADMKGSCPRDRNPR